MFLVVCFSLTLFSLQLLTFSPSDLKLHHIFPSLQHPVVLCLLLFFSSALQPLSTIVIQG